MKFKREDVGLYFSLSLVGAGVGLLVGSYISSRTKEKYVYDPRFDEAAEREASKKVQKISRKEKLSKKVKKQLNEEQKAFIEEFGPTPIQIEMLRNGLTTIERLEEDILKEKYIKEKKPYDYRGAFADDDKPDLMDVGRLPEDEGLVDDRYMFYQGDSHPSEKNPKTLATIYYDPEGEDFFRLSKKQTPIPLGSLDTVLSEEAWETLQPYLLSGFGSIYVDDTKTAKHYRFEVIEREEDLSETESDHE